MIAERTQPQPPTFDLDQVDQLQTPEQEMQMLGISSEYELSRYQKVSEVAGRSIAWGEIQRNKRAYKREFLQDIPVSEPHNYYHKNGVLYSEAFFHPLFQIEVQIDPRERDGRTIRGFHHFQKQLIQAQDEEVVLWYSPAGPAGSKEPFSEIYFDAGRLYVAFKQNSAVSTHIDIKINEEQFPIQAFMDTFGNCSLDQAVATHQKAEEFIASLRVFAKDYEEKQVYISQRDSNHPIPHTLIDIVGEVENQRALYQSIPALPDIKNEPLAPIFQRDIQRIYIQAIQEHGDQNGGETKLYGCSTTSVIKSATSIGQDGGFSGLGSPYSSFARIMSSGILSKELNQGCSIQGCIVKEPHFHCPSKNEGGCGGAIASGNGYEVCPHCGLSKDEYAKMSGVSCD